MSQLTDQPTQPQDSNATPERPNVQPHSDTWVAEASAKYLTETAGTATPVSPACPPGYKLTEVGVIPEDWEIDSIGNLLSITTGKKNTQDRVDDGIYPFFVRSQTVERINSYSYDGEGVLTAGDGVGTGKIFHYIKGKFDFHQRVYLIYNFGEEIDGYFFYIFFSNKFYDRIMSMTAKSSVDSVRREMIADMKVVLPPKKEQTAIANALSDMDALIGGLEKLIAKKQAIKTATMQQLLTGRTRLPQFALREDGTHKGYKPSELGEIPEDWEIVELGSIIEKVVGGGTPSRSNNSYWGNEIPWVTVKDFTNFCPTAAQESITKDGLKNSASNLIPKGTLIISTRMALGKAVIYKIDVAINQDLKALYCGSCLNTKFLYYWFEFNSNKINDLGSGSTVKGLSLSDLIKIEFLLPSIKEQTAIATILSDMDEEIQALQQRLPKPARSNRA